MRYFIEYFYLKCTFIQGKTNIEGWTINLRRRLIDNIEESSFIVNILKLNR